jgi:hypothetical protein
MCQFRRFGRPHIRLGLELLTHPPQITAGTKTFALRGQDHDPHSVIGSQVFRRGMQFRDHLRRHGVVFLGPRQPQRRHTPRIAFNPDRLAHHPSPVPKFLQEF